MKSRLDPNLDLTARKVEIVGLLASGKRVKEIAKMLDISVETIYEHIDMACRRLGAHSTPELIRIALHHGFISEPE